MKIFVILIISFIILIQKGWSLPVCNLKTALQNLPPRIFAEQTIDGPDQPVLLTRFFHNKAVIFTQEFTRCYFYSLDPNFIYKSVGFIGIVAWLNFVYQIASSKKIFLLIFFLVIPILPFIYLSSDYVAYSHKVFAIIGLTFLLKDYQNLNGLRSNQQDE